MRRRLVVGNWKMHGSREQVNALLTTLVANEAGFTADVAVCPPSIFISQACGILADSEMAIGAQTVSEEVGGAFTGEISVQMLKEFDCRYVIVGHSERRSLYAETDAMVAAKFVAAQTAGVTPVLCLGESFAQRESGETLAVVAAQLQAVIDAAGVDAMAKAVVAYEPIWAIGTGLTATPAQAQQVHQYLREQLAAQSAAVAQAVQLLYGGSVNAANAAELFAQEDIDGALVGGASLKDDAFTAICSAV